MSVRLMDGVTLTISSAEGLVAELREYGGPIPRKGDYIEHPRPGGRQGSSNVMQVRSVTYGILRRAADGTFAAEGDPWVEVIV